MEKKEKIHIPVGASSLLTIFSVLCLLIFSLLSLMTANANKRITDQSIQSIMAYYEADYQAEQILAEIRAGKNVEGVIQSDDNVYTYECKISDRKTLCVEVSVDNGEFIIHKWNVISTFDWEADNTMKVWDGEIDE